MIHFGAAKPPVNRLFLGSGRLSSGQKDCRSDWLAALEVLIRESRPKTHDAHGEKQRDWSQTQKLDQIKWSIRDMPDPK
jgi:hypothetical protein